MLNQAFAKIVSSVSLRALNRFLESHQDVASHLCKRSSEDQAYDVSGTRNFDVSFLTSSRAQES
jgi:hypothetical protein